MKEYTKEEAIDLLERAKQNRDNINANFERLQGYATKAFEDHEVKVLVNTPGLQQFECRNKNGSWQFGFRVTCSDNLIVLSGDVDELLILPGYNRSGLRWLRGSIKSKGYLFEKVDRAHIADARRFTHEYAADAALNNICYDNDVEDVLDYYQKELNLLEECLNGDIDHEHAYYERAYGDFQIDEPSRPTCAASSLEHRYQALLKLCELLDEIDFSIAKE